MNGLQKILSYIFPASRKIKSQYSGEIEITVINGRKVLDSAHANYSYGSLQKVLKFALQKAFTPKMRKVLLLGMGGGSVIESLRRHFEFDGHITAVEMDAVIIRIAKEEFGIKESSNLSIVHMDAFDFIKSTDQKYDLIIIDLFIDINVPEQALSSGFWQSICKRTLMDGSVVFNFMGEGRKLEIVKNELKKRHFMREEYKIHGTNTIVIAHNTSA